MLTAYLTATQNLLQNPAAPVPLYDTTDLTTYINTARNQLAGESACIRFLASLPLVAAQQGYPFSSINLSGAVGVLGVFNVRTFWYSSGAGQVWVRPEPFEEFSLYELNTTAPVPGPPTVWAPFMPGVSGSLYVFPPPDQAYTASLDVACLPVALSSDSTPEAIPELWTDAVPYFAAYLALLSSQTGARTADADKMLQRYMLFVARARAAATSGVLPWINPQQPVPGGINPMPQQARQGGG